MTVSLDRQIQCVKREIRMREHAYPRRVKQARMKAAQAIDEIAAMQAVLATLEDLKAGKEPSLI